MARPKKLKEVMTDDESANVAKILKEALAARELVGGALPITLTSTEKLLCAIHDESLKHHQQKLGKRRKPARDFSMELRRICVSAIYRGLKAEYKDTPQGVSTVQEIINQLEKAGFKGAGLNDTTIRRDLREYVLKVF